PLGAPGAGDHPEQDLGEAQPGVGRAHPQVGGERQLAAAAQGEPVDRRDHRDRQPRQRGAHLAQGAGVAHRRAVVPLPHLLDARARGEDLRPAGDDDGADLLAAPHLLDGLRQLGDQHPVQGVDRRLGQGDHGQPAGDVEGDPFLLAHEWSYHPLPLLRPSSPAAALRIDSSGGWNLGWAVSVWMLREALTNTSMPVRSMVSSGPMAWPKPRRQAVSMSSAVATPLSTSFTASTLSATISRVVTNPAMS